MTGIIVIDKQKGISSAQVVGKVKRHLKVKKCGHMGTLDPLATGVLPIAVNSSTRLFEYLIEKEKVYEAIFTFGKTTDTLDSGGIVTDSTSFIPTRLEIETAKDTLVGEILQVPPMFSAKHIDGVRSYKLAMQGKGVEPQPKLVKINYIKLLGKIDSQSYSFEISCGGGTYIRSIARDLGKLTNSLCYMSDLRRVKSGSFTIDKAITLDELFKLDSVSKHFIPPQNALDFEIINLKDDTAQKLLNGVPISAGGKGKLYRVFNGANFLGIGKVLDRGLKLVTHIR